jgi:hypothetical protein
MDRLIQMVLSLFLKKGINLGINHIAQRGKAKGDMTPEERAQAAKARETAKRARQAANLARKLGR